MFKIVCEQQDVPAHDTNAPLRQPCIGAESTSFVCADRKGFGYHRVRTNARTAALVPLLAVLVAALPVPAHADVLASLTAAISLASSRCVSETSAASKSEVRMKCLA